MKNRPTPPASPYAKVVLVPVANPDTAEARLRLGLTFAAPDDGQVLALMVSTGALEATAQAKESVQKMVKKLAAQDPRVGLITRISTSIVRGILDTIREVSADLLILGVHRDAHGQLSMGNIVENIAATTACDVIIYRSENPLQFLRIVVAADGSPQSRVACEMGLQLSQFYHNSTLEAVYIQEYTLPDWEGYARIDRALETVSDKYAFQRRVISDYHFIEGLVRHIGQNDVLIVGFSESRRRQGWFAGEGARMLLNRAPGPLLLISPSTDKTRPKNSIVRLKHRFQEMIPPLTLIEQDEIAWQAHRMSLPNVDYILLIVSAATLASLGLLLDNSTVIIGAMLVAPLMQPLIALALGLATLNRDLLRRGIFTLILGISLALLVALMVGLLTPHAEITDEMRSRSVPTGLDFGVALASGVIGAYAMARKEISTALAGVAIAAALMPPLCTVALQFTLGNLHLSMEAALLFLANITGIVLTAWFVFVLFGIRPHKMTLPNKSR